LQAGEQRVGVRTDGLGHDSGSLPQPWQLRVWRGATCRRYPIIGMYRSTSGPTTST